MSVAEGDTIAWQTNIEHKPHVDIVMYVKQFRIFYFLYSFTRWKADEQTKAQLL